MIPLRVVGPCTHSGQRRHALIGIAMVLGLVSLVSLNGCGKKTRPVPPQTLLPPPIADLQFHLDEHGVTLVWSLPQDREPDPMRLPIVGFEIARAVVPAEQYCEGCPAPYGEPLQIKPMLAKDGLPATVQQYSETLLRSERRYLFRVRTLTGWGLATDYSRPVSFFWKTPAKPPADVTILPGDRELTLRWTPVTHFLDGAPVLSPLRYQIYRSSDGETFHKLGVPIQETSFKDVAVRNSERYFYQVRAVHQAMDTILEGAPCVAIEGIPHDLTPPAPPKGLVVSREANGVKLIWDRGLEPDLSGYRVYRRFQNDANPVLLGLVPASSCQFFDTPQPKTHGFWHYHVTAVDDASPPNASNPSQEAFIEIKTP